MERPTHQTGQDAEVLRLIRNGDQDVLVTLFNRNRKPVVAFIRKNSGGIDDAEDMLQEALIVLWERIRAHRYRPEAGIDTFVHAIVRNLWFRRLARKRREQAPDSPTAEIEDDAPSTLDILIAEESFNGVKHALGKLDGQCRALLVAFYWEELSMEELALRFGLANAQTAKSKKYQCKQQLKNLLQSEGGNE
jgi:RNA polymerase sigma factor (sigma-70 family)